MSIEPSKIEQFEQIPGRYSAAFGNVIENGFERADPHRAMVWNGDRVSIRRRGLKNDVGSSLTHNVIAHAAQRAHKLRPIHIPGQLHATAGSRTRSSMRWRRMRRGFVAASAKWHSTASRTITSICSHVSPSVAMIPSSRRQLAQKPPSSAGRTVKTISFM